MLRVESDAIRYNDMAVVVNKKEQIIYKGYYQTCSEMANIVNNAKREDFTISSHHGTNHVLIYTPSSLIIFTGDMGECVNYLEEITR